MTTNNIPPLFQLIVESCWNNVQKNPRTMRAFEKWEQYHLNVLVKTFKTYKKSLAEDKKAKTLSRLAPDTQIQLIEHLAQSASIELPIEGQEEKESFILSIAGSLVLGNTRKTPLLKTLEDRLAFLLPEIQQEILNTLEEADLFGIAKEYQDKSFLEFESDDELREFQELVESVKLEKAQTENSSQTGQEEDEQKPPLVSTDEVATTVSKLITEANRTIDEGSLESLCLLLAKLFSERSNLAHELKNRAERSIIPNTYCDIRNYVDDALENRLPNTVDEYNVILGSITETPGGKGFFGNVIALESLNHGIIEITRSEAVELFPNFGSVYIPHKLMSTAPKGSLITPVIATKSERGGSNSYRADEYWVGVDEILHLDSSFTDYEFLCEELKRVVFEGAKHSYWFRLSDGSLLAPNTRKDHISIQTFSEKWKFIPPQEATHITSKTMCIHSDKLKAHQLISMRSDVDVLKEYQNIKEVESEVPLHIANRLNYIQVSHKSLAREEFITNIVEMYSSDPKLDQVYQTVVSKYLEHNSPELAELKGEEARLVEEINKLQESLISLDAKHKDLEKNIFNKAEKSIANVRSNISDIVSDPFITLLLGEHKHLTQKEPYPQQKAHSSQRNSENGIITRLETALSISVLQKEMELPAWSDDLVQNLSNELKHFIAQGATIEIAGDYPYKVAEYLIRLLGYDEYEHHLSIFADGVDQTLKKIANCANLSPIVVTGISEKQKELYETVLKYRSQSKQHWVSPVILVNPVKVSFQDQPFVLSLDIKSLKKIRGGEYDLEDFETDFEELPTNITRFVARHSGILTDYLYGKLQLQSKNDEIIQ